MDLCKLKVTVITVCYNVALSIEDTIRSVISQSYDNIEYIVIDGGSTDGTVDIIRRYASEITLWQSEPDKGIYDAMNKGIRLATGDYINFMNAGDYFSTDTVIERVMSLAKEGTDIVYGDSVCKYPNGKETFIPGDTRIELLKKRPIYRHNASFVRTSLHKEIPFALEKSKEYEYALDYNNIFTLWHVGAKFQKVDVNVVTYTREGTSDRPIKNIILPYRISHQFNPPTFKERCRFILDLLRAFLYQIRRPITE